jgi:4-amino-4-deoxy-L-arabinose transferase-like glycosyltransferase
MTALDRLHDLLRRRPLGMLAALTALQTAFTFSTRALWFSDEVRYADAYAGLLRGKWLVLNLNGVAYPDKPPLYFWLIRALDAVSGLDDPAVFFLAAAVSGFLVLWSVLLLARSLRLADEAGPMAGAILLGTFFFAGLLHYSRMDLLFAALITASQAAFCSAFAAGNETRRTRLSTLALFLAGLATLTKGPLGLLFPILTTLIFLAWRGRTREFFTRGMLPGLGALLAITCSWVLAAYCVEGPLFLRHIFYEQIFLRATKTFHHAEPWSFYLKSFPLCWLPWMLALVALPVHRLLTAEFWRGLWSARKNASPQGDARAWLWISAISGLALLSLLSGKVVIYVLPQLCPLALLMALGLMDGRLPWRRLWIAAGLLFMLLAAALPLAGRFLPPPLTGRTLPGAWLVAGGFAACGAALLALRKAEASRVPLALALATALWVQPAAQRLAPSLDAIMSPRPQAELLRAYAAQGYLPVAHDTYQGIYSYYLGGVLRETAGFNILDPLATGHDVVIAMKRKKWDAWPERPANLAIVFEQWLAGERYVVAAGRADGGEPPILSPAP